MSTRIQLTSFPDLSREDTVSLTLGAAGSPDEAEFVLETDSGVTWWKALELRSSSDRMTNEVHTQDANHGPLSFSVQADTLIGARLTLAKAKLGGWHTGMYELADLSSFRGRSLHFLWQRDDDKDGPVVGFFRDLGEGICAAADAVANAGETVVETVAETASTVIEAIGTTAANGLDALGNFLGGVPLVGGLFRGACHWAATVVSAYFDFQATVAKAFLDLVANVLAGGVRIVFGGIGGLLSGDGRVFVKGTGDVASGVAGAVISVAAKVLALVQAAAFLQLGERPLTDSESTLLWRIYRNSIDRYNIRVIDGWTFLSVFDRAPTIGNRIYMGGTANTGVDNALYEQTIVHECCHVWQYKHIGTRYVSDCIWAWATQPAQGYDWQGYYSSGIQVWQDMNTEAQAEFIQEVAVGRRNSVGQILVVPGTQVPTKGEKAEFLEDDPIGSNVDFTIGKDNYTEFARVSVAYVRSHLWFIAKP
jgi:hypothetical protein